MVNGEIVLVTLTSRLSDICSKCPIRQETISENEGRSVSLYSQQDCIMEYLYLDQYIYVCIYTCVSLYYNKKIIYIIYVCLANHITDFIMQHAYIAAAGYSFVLP